MPRRTPAGALWVWHLTGALAGLRSCAAVRAFCCPSLFLHVSTCQRRNSQSTNLIYGSQETDGSTQIDRTQEAGRDSKTLTPHNLKRTSVTTVLSYNKTRTLSLRCGLRRPLYLSEYLSAGVLLSTNGDASLSLSAADPPATSALIRSLGGALGDEKAKWSRKCST